MSDNKKIFLIFLAALLAIACLNPITVGMYKESHRTDLPPGYSMEYSSVYRLYRWRNEHGNCTYFPKPTMRACAAAARAYCTYTNATTEENPSSWDVVIP